MLLKKHLVILSLPLLVTACAGSESTDGMLSPTIYYLPTIHQNSGQCSANDLSTMRTSDDRTLATLCESDIRLCHQQGSCFVEKNGDIGFYSFHGMKNGEPRFLKVSTAKCPYGYGVKGACLDPYFSVAADLNYHSVGDVIYIPRLVGVVLSTGEVHDGYVIIRDSGVYGPSRFDFFTGMQSYLLKTNTFGKIGLGDPSNRFEYRVVTDDQAQIIRAKRNYPGLPK
ncbi:MAG: 3D domain-containing protein [Pseudobdellovibrionaceae bacterium]